MYSNQDAGGIAAVLCEAERERQLELRFRSRMVPSSWRTAGRGITMNGAGTDGAVGVLPERQKKPIWLIMCHYQNGTSDRIHGKGYIGGIAGIMNQSGIYNSYVNGTIGGNGSRAVAASSENMRVET